MPERDTIAAPAGGYVEVASLRAYYESYGDGPPVVCIHTAGMDGSQWRYAAPEIARAGFRAIALDLPGHGRSDLPAGGPIVSALDFADFVAAFCDALSLSRVSVVGCSVGGDIALALAIRHGELVERCVACACAAMTRGFPDLLLKMGETSAGAPGWNDMFAENCQASIGGAISPDRLRQLTLWHRHASRELGNADLRAWNDFDVRADLGAISAPVLLIHGAADYFVPADRVQQTADGISGARAVWLDDVGHYPMVEDPAGFGDTVVGFLGTEAAMR